MGATMRFRRILSRRVCLLTCAASIAIAFGATAVRAAEPSAVPGPDGWFEGAPPDGSFRVRGPVRFEAFSQEDARGSTGTDLTQGVRATQPAAFDGTVRYIASCVERKPDTRSSAERMDESLAYWAGQVDFAYRREVAVGTEKGVEFQIADPNKAMRVRVYAPRGRTCTWLVKWDHFAKPRMEDVGRFLESFELRAR